MKKSLVIVRVNPIVFPMDKAEQVRKQLIKQLKSGVLMIDKSCTIECYNLNTKNIELKIVDKDSQVGGRDEAISNS